MAAAAGLSRAWYLRQLIAADVQRNSRKRTITTIAAA